MRAGYSVTKNLIVSAFILKSRQINRAKEPVSTPNQILEKEKVNLGLLVQSPIKLILD